MLEIREATTEDELDAVRALVHSFLDWARQLYPDAQDLVDQNFKVVEAELASLPGAYGPPTGKLLVAYSDGEVAGTVAMRDIGNHICEMKRMFVYAKFHGKGSGRALANALISASRELGYSQMRLDTGPRQVAAQGLYRSLGFQEIPPYYALPKGLRTGTLFMELRL